jgi:hypothetical protein
MALIGGLRLIAGLAFLGVVITVCLWLLNKLFPGTASVSHGAQNLAIGKHSYHETSGVAPEHGSQNKSEYKDERKPR